MLPFLRQPLLFCYGDLANISVFMYFPFFGDLCQIGDGWLRGDWDPVSSPKLHSSHWEPQPLVCANLVLTSLFCSLHYKLSQPSHALYFNSFPHDSGRWQLEILNHIIYFIWRPG